MYIQYIQGLGQSRLSTADHALLLVAPATTAVLAILRVFYNLSARTTQKTPFFYYCRGVLSRVP
jgi:hypothetical protein